MLTMNGCKRMSTSMHGDAHGQTYAIPGDLGCRQQLKGGGVFFPVCEEMQDRCFEQFDWEFLSSLALSHMLRE